ncbi:MAG: DUF4138 domain-containing protein [Candidatus Amoebophilus sp.]
MKKNHRYLRVLTLAILRGVLVGQAPTLFAQAAAPLSLAVSEKGITVVVLEGKINEVNIGSDEYVAKVNQHYLLLKSRKAQAAPTSLFVTYNNHQQFLHATLMYASKPPTTYDLRASLAPENTLADDKNKEVDKKWASPQMLRRIESLAFLPQQYKDIGMRRDQLTAIVTHILSDADYFYLQLFIRNKASAAFKVDEASFCYVSGSQERVEVSPIVAPLEEIVPARAHESWVYVLPSYALKQQDRLEINLWEKKGSRHLRLVIPSSILLTSLYEAS